MTVMCLCDRSDNGQPEPGAFTAFAAASPLEAFENSPCVLGRHPRTGVTHPEPNQLAVDQRSNGDDLVPLGVSDSVGGELHECLSKPLAVGDHRSGHPSVETPFAFPESSSLVQYVVGQHPDIHWP